MTIRTKRRGRTLAAILAAMLMASVLSVVAGGPAQAANTSGEVLIDTNSDGIGDTREFAGSHRYNTAVALAQRFADDNGGVTTVIIASGETEVDAVTASGLAGNQDAAVLLTRSNQLPHNVARYIDEHNVTEVIVVGGTASVPDSIITAIESLGADPDVQRISGADRYETAARIGNELGGPNPTWCGSTQSAAILVNGGAEGRADAVAIGPLAYALGLPVLLTAADELPQATEDFLTDNKVERVVIVGGEGAVSADIEDDLVENVGVVNTQRISGGTAAGTSVDIAKEMLGNCADVLGTSSTMVALVNRDATADGIASAPVLGRGLGGGGPVPILLVGDELPAAVSDYLAGTAEVNSAGQKTHLGILAIGGTAVVSNAVMDAAKMAAKTSGDITATIKAAKYSVADLVGGNIPAGKSVGDYKNMFTVSFSDPVADASVSDPTLYRINGRRLEALVDTETGNEESLAANHKIDVANGIVTVTLVHALEEGDTITVVGGSQVARARNGDRRPLQQAEETLGAVTTAQDRAAPRIEIIAVAGSANFDVLIHEPNVLYNELTVNTNLSEFISVAGASIPASTSDADPPVRTERTDRAVTITGVTTQTATGRTGGPSVVRLQFTVTAAATENSPNQTDPADTLIPGDVITVNRNAVRDDDGRSNALTRHTVQKLKDAGKFEVSSVSIGNVRHGTLAGGGHAMATIGDDMVVKAKATGGAAGAQGNGWKIYGYDDRPNGEANVFEWDIRVGVDTANQVISFTIYQKPAVPGFEKVARAAPNLGNLADKLAADDDFAAHFSLDFVRDVDGNTDDSRSTALGATSATGVPFTGGTSSVGVVVRFNDNVETLLNDGTDLAYDIAADFDAGLTATAGDDGLTVTFAAPDNQVHISYTSARMLNLPKRSGFRVIAAGVATSYGAVDGTDTTNIREILNSLRPDAGVSP